MDTRRVGRAVVSKGELHCRMAAEPSQRAAANPQQQQLLEETEGQGTPEKSLE